MVGAPSHPLWFRLPAKAPGTRGYTFAPYGDESAGQKYHEYQTGS
jgi:hypothetical protein